MILLNTIAYELVYSNTIIKKIIKHYEKSPSLYFNCNSDFIS